MRSLKIISFIFHPLPFPIAIVLFNLYFLRNTFKVNQEKYLLLFIFISTYLIPLVLLLLLKQFKFIKSIYLKTAEERKIPVIFLLIVYFILGKMFLKLGLALNLGIFFLANSLALAIVYLFLQQQKKISLHTLGLGGLIGYIIVISYNFQLNFLIILSALFILSGIIATTRLQLKAHSKKEIYQGFFISFFSQLIIFITYSLVYSI